METATTYVQNLISVYRVPDFSGYRVPDISKLWRQSDSAVDGEQQKPQVPQAQNNYSEIQSQGREPNLKRQITIFTF